MYGPDHHFNCSETTTYMSHNNPFSRLPRRHPAPATRRRRVAALAALSVLVALTACLDSTTTTTPTLTPASVVLVSGDAQVGAGGNTLPIPVTVRVLDATGVPVSYATVTFAPTSTLSGTASATTVYSDTTGSAGVQWTLGPTIRTDSLIVTVTGLTTTITVTAQVTTGAPSAIAIVSGDAQTAPAGTTLSTPLVVRVTDQLGDAVPNARVSWSSDASGGYAFTSASAVTDADGKAQAVYTLGANPGLQHVTLMVSTGAGAMLVTFTATGS